MVCVYFIAMQVIEKKYGRLVEVHDNALENICLLLCSGLALALIIFDRRHCVYFIGDIKGTTESVQVGIGSRARPDI